MDLAISNVTATAARFTYTNTVAGRTIQVQIGTRPDFKLCVAPIIGGIAYNAGNNDFGGLNQLTTYYARAREVITATGVEQAWTPVQSFRTAAGAARDTSAVAITHAPAMLVVPNPVLEWGAGDQQAGYPVENLGYDAPVAWRSIAAGNTHTFNVRMGPDPVDTIALLMSNVPEAGQVQVRAGNTKNEATNSGGPYAVAFQPFRASPNLPGRPGYHALIRLPAPVSYPWWEIAIATGGTPGALLHLEHAIFGLNRTTKNHALDKNEAPVDLGTFGRSRTGVPQRALGARMRRVDFEIGAMTEAQYEVAYGDLGWEVGNTEPVLAVPNSKAGAYLHDRILYGTLASGPRITNLRGPLFTRGFSIDSIIP